MRILAVVILTAVFAVFAFEAFSFWQKNSQLAERYDTLQAKLSETLAESEKLKQDLNYFMQPENLEKEFRARFNYKKEGEKMMIIVPQKTTDN